METTLYKTDVQEQLQEMLVRFYAWCDQNSGFYSQENCPEFYPMINLVMDNKTEKEIDLHKLTKYQVEVLLDKLFFDLASSSKKQGQTLHYSIIVGKGLHSPDGVAVLPDKVKDICKRSFGVSAEIDPENTGVIIVEISRDSATKILLMQEIKEEIRLLESTAMQNFPRVFIGYARSDFKAVAINFFNMRNYQEMKAKNLIWEEVMMMASHEFVETSKNSPLRSENSKLFGLLNTFYSAKPHSFQDFLESRKYKQKDFHIVYTYTPYETNILKEKSPFKEFKSPESEDKDVEKILQISQDLVLRFVEIEDFTKEKKPLTKILQNYWNHIKKLPKYRSGKIIIIIHLINGLDRESNYLVYHWKFNQVMIDDLIGESEPKKPSMIRKASTEVKKSL